MFLVAMDLINELLIEYVTVRKFNEADLDSRRNFRNDAPTVEPTSVYADPSIPFGSILFQVLVPQTIIMYMYFCCANISRRRVAATPRPRRGYSAEARRGDAAAATRIFRGGASRRRRGRDVDIPWTPRRGYSVATAFLIFGRDRDADSRSRPARFSGLLGLHHGPQYLQVELGLRVPRHGRRRRGHARRVRRALSGAAMPDLSPCLQPLSLPPRRRVRHS